MFDTVKTLADLFELKLQGLYDAEIQVAKALPALTNAATNPHLRLGLEQYLRETESQAAQLEQVAASLGLSLPGLGCKAMESLVEEGDRLLSFNASDEVIDAAVISVAQQITHYNIAQYDTVVRFAQRLSYTPVASLLGSILAVEKHTSETLKQLAGHWAAEQVVG
ncbi:ferritin-like domain-containing protein [Hymenobacter sp. BT559]|uniref:YciE/YciF ferroxidase family protein n=1 Tax=Hymenobacter sp. BT559 TaxID=2795729 RepID=UPI0018ED3EBF|nr:DUF892 family protein [Hymenobacter sp. BT559]MBJ6145043.1 DUF892 family protein [Hymenobacter sp. BT559]